MKKFYCARLRSAKLFNVLTSKNDIEVSALIASKIEKYLFSSVAEIKELLDDCDYIDQLENGSLLIQMVDEDINHDGEHIGLYKIPYRLRLDGGIEYAYVNADNIVVRILDNQ